MYQKQEYYFLIDNVSNFFINIDFVIMILFYI